MKKLPIGIQEFSKLREGDFLYVDKTQHIYNLINSASYYFLSRPRRFGKSLLLNTIKEIFNGNKQLFEGLWIYDKIDWEVYPVIKISFSRMDYNSLGLEKAIENTLLKLAEKYKISLNEPTYSLKFEELIHKLAQDKKVVILIDEYDKPIIDYIDDIPQAEENRKILKSFYSIIKDSDSFIKFFFITGVSKFSQVSIFSDLNNLDDITLDKNYATLTGYTQEELDFYFPEYIEKVKEDYKGIIEDIPAMIKRWYNGYSWDGKNFVYNPFSILNFFSKREFDDYWFRTGTPTFLMKMIKKNKYTIFDIKNREITKSVLDKYDITSITLLPLLFQTGYLTIKKYDLRTRVITLDFPNAEVENAFIIHLLAELNDGKIDKASSLIIQLMESLESGNLDKFIELINIIYKGISYTIVDEKEKYYHSIFYIIVKLLGFTIDVEVLTIDGRIDAVISVEDTIYIIEFKANQDAATALQQIEDKGYYKKYLSQGKQIILVGINFDTEEKKITEYVSKNIHD